MGQVSNHYHLKNLCSQNLVLQWLYWNLQLLWPRAEVCNLQSTLCSVQPFFWHSGPQKAAIPHLKVPWCNLGHTDRQPMDWGNWPIKRLVSVQIAERCHLLQVFKSPLLLHWFRSSRVILECPKPLFSLTKLHNEELIPFLQCSSPEQIANWCRKCRGTISNWGKSLDQQNLCRHPTLGKLLTPTSWSPKCGKYHCIDCNSYRWRTPECGKWEEAGQTQVPPTLELR